MKSQFLFCLFFVFLTTWTWAQNDSNFEQPVSINAAGTAPDSSAMLDVNSSSKGMLIPRMSTADRMAISSPADGLIVYDTTMKVPCHYTGSIWRCIEIPTCFTLDQSYDCGGPGFGRMIAVDSGAVMLTGSATTTPTLVVSSSSIVTGSIFGQSGMGSVASFTQTDPLSPSSAVNITHGGLGIGQMIDITNPMNASDALLVNHAGMGVGGFFNSINMLNPLPTIQADQFGVGSAGLFNSMDPLNPSSTLVVNQMGLGGAGHFTSMNPANMSATLLVDQMGLGHAGYFESFDPGNTMATVEAMNDGKGDGVHGIAVDSMFTTSGVTGTGRYNALNAAALNAHDGAIRVSKTVSPNTPAEVFDTVLVSWLPMDNCPATCGPPNPGQNNYAWNSDIITINNVYIDPARSVITHSIQVQPPFFLRSVIRAMAPGSFDLQFVLDVDACTAFCPNPPPAIPIRVHYLVVNQ